MRVYTGEASLAPVTTERTIEVEQAASRATLLFETNTADRRQAIALAGTSTDEPKGENGQDGP
jgi:hypothetical protein